MYLRQFNDRNQIVLFVIAIHTSIYFVNAAAPYENNDINKYKLDPTRYIFDIFKQNQKIGPKSLTTQKNPTTENNSVTEATHIKKWQVGRVSRKQYEIINMLWRKTKEFPDVAMSSTVSPHPGYPLYRLPSRLHATVTSSTPSFIEFYYLNENDDRKKHTDRNDQPSKEPKSQRLRNPDIFRNIDYPIFSFHVNHRNYEHFVSKHKDSNIQTPVPSFVGYVNAITAKNPNKRSPANLVTLSTRLNSIVKISTVPLYVIDNNTCPHTTLGLVSDETETENKHPNKYFTQFTIDRILPESTIAYDKIKFFEMYDKETPLPYYKDEAKQLDFVDIKNSINRNNEEKILLEHVDQSLGEKHSNVNKANPAKKHIIENNKSYPNNVIVENTTRMPTTSSSTYTKKKIDLKDVPMNESLSTKSKTPAMPGKIINKVAKWSDYSFMAVYIYEPAQVHCDAAGISPHWLVTSGSCLSRHHKNPDVDGRTAFVAYCGVSWWTAERIAYVKYSVVHPHFHPKDNNRRYMYNIGLIQVVISLTTCPGWAPISLMSHRFIADPAGSYAIAIGWGLDRYNTRYTSADLPKYPLMAYESRVFSDSCPGSLSYTEMMRQFEDETAQNLYCLSLPPYSGEDTDPIHGSMLVIGGKLCAIYLQEERRPSGEQSAEYTGTWRLGPWVSHVAKEPDDAEPFTFVI